MHSFGSKRGVLLLLVTAIAGAGALGCDGGEPVVPSSTTATGGGGTASGGGAGGTAGQGGTGGGEPFCGDGIVNGIELCDDANDVPLDGCETDCSFSCTQGTAQGDAKCDDGDPCNGPETCSEDHACLPGTHLPSGTDCGDGKVCKAGTCGDLVCGDAFVDPGEDCDDGNLDPDDGCDACSFTCVIDADCDPADACAGDGLCAADRTCETENPLPDGTPCDGGVCVSGACFEATCGNGAKEPGEECDDGNLVSGDGCDDDCDVSCEAPATDCPAPPPCNTAVCTASKTCSTQPDLAANGAACGQDLVCMNGACIGDGAVCGNGVLEPGEDCDFGAANGPGTGCETICKFSCTKTPDSCVDANLCDGAEACNTVVVDGKLGQKCSQGSTLATCQACGAGLCNAAGTCVPSTCGDGCIDLPKGEGCEPPNGPGCDAACKIKICGNGVREAGEECDDGDTDNLDGCSSVCRFEQLHRVRYLVLQYASDTLCQQNQLGAAIISPVAQSQLQGTIDTGVQLGAIEILFQFLGLDDLTGTADPALQLGTMGGHAKVFGAYDGTNDLDHWHGVDPDTVDANGVPLALVPASIAAKVLTAGPGAIDINVSLGAGPATLSLSAVQMSITLGAATKPLVSSNGLPPGHVFSEHLDPALTSFATAGQPNANGAGRLCGNVTAASLAAMPLPEDLATGGFACAEGYSLASTMLDVIAGGCTVFGATQIAPTQPDQVNPAAPPAGAGAPYTFVKGSQPGVTACTDKNGATVPLAACLSAAAYSTFFKLATNRVIPKN